MTFKRTALAGLLCLALPCLAALLIQPRGMEAQSLPSPEIQRRIERVGACLTTPVVEKNDPDACQTLADRMAADHVPGVSIAVIHNGDVEWAQGFGLAQLGGVPVTAETLFQAGSISKPVAAMAALRLVQEGKLSLDSDVNQLLTSWKIPPSAAAPSAVVTLRELLNHTAGMTVHGFPGYAAGTPIPTLVQILNGEKPANTAPVRLEAPPGSRWQYSGGGYTVMQQLLIDVSHERFAKLMRDAVLVPIGMTRSTYEQPLPVELRAGAATPYNADGTPVAGGSHIYPEMAAAGLWTTPTDLAHYAIEIQRSLRGDANHVLSAEMTRQMLVAGLGNYGLGLVIGGAPENPYFSHGGINAGFENALVAFLRTGDGAVVMTNAQGGQQLAGAVIRSIASVYGWSNFHPIVRASIAVDPAILATYVGVYELNPALSIAITLENGQLMEQASNERKFPIFPESPNGFFLKIVDARVEFFTTPNGQVSHLVWHQQGSDTRWERRQ
jgi:CubicO group peptidase (beta-lactamase class C family)